MKRLLIGIGVLLLVLAGAALLLPSLIDWNRHRQEIADFLAMATGRAVVISGPVDFTMLPRPTLTVGDVTFSVPEGERTEVMADIRRVGLRIRPLPLLRGVVQIESLSLIEPRMRLEALADGGLRGPIALASLGSTVQIDRLSIEDGSLTLRDAARDRQVVLDRIRGEVDAGGPDGPFNVAGGFFLNDLPMSIDVTTGRIGEGGALPVRATLDLPDGASTLRYAGVVAGGPAPMAQGELRGEGQRLAGLAEAVAAMTGRPTANWQVPALGQPYEIRGTLSVERSTVSLEGVDWRFGASRGGGTLDVRRGGRGMPPAVGLVLSVAQLDLESLLPRSAGEPSAGGPPATDFPLLDGIGLKLDVLADQVSWGGDAIRDVRLLASLADGRWDVAGLNATLPGNTVVAIAGDIRAEQGRPRTDMSLEITADSLRDTLAWLGVDVSTVPLERLRQARLTGRVIGRVRDFQLVDAAGSLDTTSFTGAVSVARPDRLGIGLKLEADRLNLDAYGIAPGTVDWVALSRAFDANADMRVGQLTFGGVPMDGVAVSGTLSGGALTLRDLSAESVAGVKARIAGRIGGLAPLGASHLSLTAEGETLASLFRALDVAPPVPPERIGPMRLDGRIAGDAGRMALEAEAAFKGGTLQVGGAVADPGGTAALDLKIRGTFAETADLVRLVLPDWRPGRAQVGAFDVYGELSGTPRKLEIKAIQGTAGGTVVRGGAMLERGGAKPSLDLALQTDSVDLDLLMPTLASRDGDAWSLDWTRAVDLKLALDAETLSVAGQTLDDAVLSVRGGDGALILERLDGRWRGGELSASGRLATGEATDAASDARSGLDGTIALRVAGAAWPERDAATGRVDLSGGRVDLRLEGQGRGATPRSVASTLSGTLEFAAAGGAVTGIDLPALMKALETARGGRAARAALAASIGRGRTGIAGLSGRFAIGEGVLRSDSLTVESAAGVMTASGWLDTGSRRLDLTILVDPARPEAAPQFKALLTGSMDNPDRAFDADALIAWADARQPAPTPAAPVQETPVKEAPTGKAPAGNVPAQQAREGAAATDNGTPAPAPASRPGQETGPEAIKGILDRLKQ